MKVIVFEIVAKVGNSTDHEPRYLWASTLACRGESPHLHLADLNLLVDAGRVVLQDLRVPKENILRSHDDFAD
jgi:hypothetical protein